MAGFDTISKRISSLMPWMPFGPIPWPDGEIDRGDQQHLCFLYSGLLVDFSSIEYVLFDAESRKFVIGVPEDRRIELGAPQVRRFEIGELQARRFSLSAQSRRFTSP